VSWRIIESLAHLYDASGEDPASDYDKLKRIAKGLGEAAVDFAKCAARGGLTDAADWYEIVTGKEWCGDSDITITGRLVSAAGLIAGSSKVWRKAAELAGLSVRVAKKGTKKVFDLTAEIVDSAKKIGLNTAPQVKQLATTIEKSGVKAEKVTETLDAIGKSDSFARAVKATHANKPMFYVKASGEAIPSTAYRYVGSDANYLKDFIAKGEIPAGNYFSFDKFDDMAQASNKLQVPHDARFRAEFDTLPYVDKARISKGAWGKADYLEPITKDFPDFGEGGATQAVIDAGVSVSRIVDLKTGKIVFER
jgi:hypothetical protein